MSVPPSATFSGSPKDPESTYISKLDAANPRLVPWTRADSYVRQLLRTHHPSRASTSSISAKNQTNHHLPSKMHRPGIEPGAGRINRIRRSLNRMATANFTTKPPMLWMKLGAALGFLNSASQRDVGRMRGMVYAQAGVGQRRCSVRDVSEAQRSTC
jgi:hypothetical protein